MLTTLPLRTLFTKHATSFLIRTMSTFTPAEETEITQWITTSTRLSTSTPTEQLPLLTALNTHLSSRTTVLGTKPSKADAALYQSLLPIVKTWSAEQKTGENGNPNIIRHLDFVQNSPVFKSLIEVKEEDKLKVDQEEVLYVKPPVDAKAEKERLKKEKAAAAAAAGGDAGIADRTAKKGKGVVETVTDKVVGAKDAVVTAVAGGAATEGQQPQGGRAKKEKKAPKPAKAPAVTAPLSPALIDLRVGHILKAIKHPEADSLFVSTIAMGDKAGADDTIEFEGQVVRTVCSGLNGLVPLEEMQGRKVVVVCNLKPVKMRGVKSSAMVLAASPKLAPGVEDNHAGPVELVTPPEGSIAGERVYFEGWQGEPEGVLNPKKGRVWETIQPGFKTTSDFDVVFDASIVKELSKEGEEPKVAVGKLVTTSGGVCKVKSLVDAIVR